MNEATSSSATPRTKATAKTTAKKPTTKRTSKPKTATKRTVGETPAPIINRTSPGLDRWEAMVKIGDHSDLKPWEDGYADVKKTFPPISCSAESHWR